MGIRPTLSTRAEVEQILHDANINYETTLTVVEGDTYRWLSDLPSLSNEPEQDRIHVSVAFDENDIVWGIGFVPTEICARTLVRWFGIPPAVLRYENDSQIDLVYPEQGLIVLINLNTSGNVGTVFIRSERAANAWVEQAGSQARRSWDQVEAILTQDCQDDAGRTCPFACP